MKTLVLLGNGAKTERIDIWRWVTCNNLPVVYSMNGKGVIRDTHPNVLGMIGTWGKANQALLDCERLIVIGSRLDVRQVSDLTMLDGKEIHLISTDTVRVTGIRYKNFNTFVKKFKGKFSPWVCDNPTFNKIETIINTLSYKFRGCIVTTDVGENQIICANAWDVMCKEQFITSAGLGTMGFAIPAAIGSCCGKFLREKSVVAVCGDGGFQMNIQELETIKCYDLPIKIIVLNNNKLKLVSDFQKEQGLSTITTVEGYSCPSIKRIAQAYEFKYFKQPSLDKFVKCRQQSILEINYE